MLVEFVVGSLPVPRGFSPGSSVFLPPQKPTLPNSNRKAKGGTLGSGEGTEKRGAKKRITGKGSGIANRSNRICKIKFFNI